MKKISNGLLIGAALTALLTGCGQAAPTETENAQPVEETTETAPAETESEESPSVEPTTLITLDEAVAQCLERFAGERNHYANEADFVSEWGGPLDVNNPPVNVVIGYMDGEYYMEFTNDAQPDNNVWCRTQDGQASPVMQPGISVYERYMYR